MTSPGYEILPVTAQHWSAMQALFGPRGACAGCWCMFWRIPHKQFDQQKGEANRLAMQQLIDEGRVPGLIAFAPDHASDSRLPVGWISIGPREDFPPLAKSRILKPIDDQPVWSVVCFFVSRPYRRKGLTVQLLNASVKFAREQGANIIEGYPVDPKPEGSPDVFVYTGLPSAFQKAGFCEVARRSPTRPIMRKYLDPRN